MGRWRGLAVPARLALVLVLVEVLATVGDLILGPWARTHWEELFNVTTAQKKAGTML